jgi:dimethylamine/trimethylamine dehydrogenase
MAELLALEGWQTHLVTPYPVVSPVSDDTLEGAQLRAHLHEVGVRAHRGVTLSEVLPDHVVGADELGEEWLLPCAGVVLVTQQESDVALYGRLNDDPDGLRAAGVRAVHTIGDAVAPRLLSEVVFDGHRLARELDGQTAGSYLTRENPTQ